MAALAASIYGRDERAPSIEVQSILTFARQAIGWSGKFMPQQLQQAREWAMLAAEAEVHRLERVEELGYTYDGVELDAPEDRPLIQDFLDHAEWFLPSRVRDRTIPGLMLMSTDGGRLLQRTGIYVDRVGAARHYIGLYGTAWRDYIRSID